MISFEVFAKVFLLVASFAAPMVSLPPYQFARERKGYSLHDILEMLALEHATKSL
jgi:hypothetical protein